MTWYADSDNQAAAEALHLEVVDFVYMDLPSGALRLHTRTGTISWGGYDWLGVGKFGEISDVSEDAMLRPSGVTYTLSGVDAALITAARTDAIHGRATAVYIGFLDTTTLALVADPQLRFRGVIDTMSVELGQNTGSITVQTEGELARWQRHGGLLYTAESQQEIYPGDKGLDNIPVIQNRTISWAKKFIWGFSTTGRFPTPAKGPT